MRFIKRKAIKQADKNRKERLDIAERETLRLAWRLKRAEIELGVPEPLIVDIRRPRSTA